MNEALRNKILKSSTIKATDVFSESAIINEKDTFLTSIHALNIALTGELYGHFNPGLLTIAGPSKHFKTLFALILAAAYMETYPEAIMILYDSEFGAALKYFEMVGIDMNRVIHTPITNIEELKHDCAVQLDAIERGEKVIIVIDSVGNLASKKEAKDAVEGNSAADMTRAKELKSFGRIVTPHLTIKDIYMIAVNHTYKEMSLFPRDIVSGGTGLYYSSNDIWIIGRQQDKDKKTGEIEGYDFIINIEKSRKVKEKSKIPVSVSFETGIDKYSGLLEMGIESGVVTQPKVGSYQIEIHSPEHKVLGGKRKNLDTIFWNTLIESYEFEEYVKNTYQLGKVQLINDDE